jgi:4-oxalocrotonate tautomerase
MPHVNIKHFPPAVPAERRERLAAAVTAAITEHMGAPAGAVSVSLEPVAEADWHDAVVVPELTGRGHLLIRRPDYLKEEEA